MSAPRLFKRRQILLLSGAGMVGFLGGGAATAEVLHSQAVSYEQPANGSSDSLTQPLAGYPTQVGGPYLNPGGFDQQFLTKPADVFNCEEQQEAGKAFYRSMPDKPH